MNATRVLMAGALLACLTGMATAQTEWVVDPADPVLEPGPPGSWDGGGRAPTSVIKVDGFYHMYFRGWSGDSQWDWPGVIGHATSADGVIWEIDPANPVLKRGAEGEWDAASLWGTAVIHDGSEFRMWYSGTADSSDALWFGGYATSPDGSTWTKYPGNPIIDVGSPGSFDEKGVCPQTVILEGELYRMWYLAGAESIFPFPAGPLVGYAESDDGLSWRKHPEPVLEPGRGDVNGWYLALSVVSDEANYHMVYSGFGVGWREFIGYAFSADGIHWTRYSRSRVIRILAGLSSPRVVYDQDAGVFQMWYLRSRDMTSSVYRATSECCSTAYSWFIPAAARGAGAGDAFFETAVDISNAGGTTAEFRIAWLPRGEDNKEWRWSEFDTLDPGASHRYNNVLAEVFDLEPDAYGSLVIEASSEDLLAMSRIFNNRDKAAGSYGQAMPALRLKDFTGIDERRRILFGTENAEMRFNVGCQSAYEFDLRIHLGLFDAAGTLLKTATMTLKPWSNRQLDRIFDDFRPVTGYVDVWIDDWGLFYCYGSMLDNTTSDPTTIPPM